ncbi:hypothetical protein FA15DRAFT_680694 [Coprinopsis marcescibilis]|uniref:BTB domain-containing protein n=1 Tax=Coprinopsis marcescibilis TaxID=230819 RepID=A0A5C3KX91_COPMA|nr:hypothetical protein FA15DRAFT_680694 [Coprinopsis marcescibilis]
MSGCRDQESPWVPRLLLELARRTLQPETALDFNLKHLESSHPIAISSPLALQRLNLICSCAGVNTNASTHGEEESIVSVSTTFYPGGHQVEPDTIFSSSDNVVFYVSSQKIRSASPDAFVPYLSATSNEGDPRGYAPIPETSTVLNILLHALYGSSCAHNSPTFEDLSAAVDRMPQYGIVPKIHVGAHAPIHAQLLAHAPLRPIALYALAAKHDLEHLAVKTSSHLLSFPLASIDDEIATSIGPVYLKRLFMLHISRMAALKQIVLQPPQTHAPSQECTSEDQKRLAREWTLATVYLVWNARPDLSTHRIQMCFRPLFEALTCKQCEASANSRIRGVVVSWASVKVSH